MKNILIIALIFCSAVAFAQQDRTLEYNKKTKLTEAKYFHDNGVISQEGTFNSQGKLQGQWISYDKDGKKVAVANYENGRKVGKWFFWDNESLREVEFVDNEIVEVKEWTQSKNVAFRE